MIRTAAVVAHFDPNNQLDSTFRSVLYCLNELCEKIILVTTCQLAQDEIPTESSIVTLQRPNIGYDFYSYRVGIDEIIRQGGCERLYILNSSFVISNRQRFINGLVSMKHHLHKVRVVGMTNSLQFEPHLQSYLLLLRGDELRKRWFVQWLNSIEPRNSKFETIIANELGFSRAMRLNNVSSTALFQINWQKNLKANFIWGKRIFELEGLGGFKHVRILDKVKEYNPVHFLARSLAEQFGFVKSELLRDNPHGLNLSWFERTVTKAEKDSLYKFIEKSRSHYSAKTNGLTEYTVKSSYLPNCQIICSGPLARPGIRIAVIVHIYYPDLIEEVHELLRNIVEPFDLFVTTPHEGVVSDIFNTFSKIAQSIAVALCENRGRDIGPFMAVFRQKLLDPYLAVLKLHTKKSTYSEQGSFWRQSLFNELCGNSLTVNKAIQLIANSNVGIIGPHDNYLTHPEFWGADKEKSLVMLNSIGVTNETVDPPLGFFAGSMFWFNPVALQLLHLIPIELLAFESEHGQQDGTLAHAFERIFCNIVRDLGFIATSIILDGDEIESKNNNTNTVMVLDAPN